MPKNGKGYVLMSWPDENKYSTVKRKCLVTAYNDEELLGQHVQCCINKETYFGTVFRMGKYA